MFCNFQWLNGDVKQSRNGNRTRDLQMAANQTRSHPLCRPVVSSLFSLAARCLGVTGGAWSHVDHTTLCAGCRITAELEQRLRRHLGATCIGPSIPRVPPLISCCQRSVTPMLFVSLRTHHR